MFSPVKTMKIFPGRVSVVFIFILLISQNAESKPLNKKPSSKTTRVPKHIVATKVTILNDREATFIYGVHAGSKSPVVLHKVPIPLSEIVRSSSSSSSSSESASGSSSGSRSVESILKRYKTFKSKPHKKIVAIKMDKSTPRKQSKIAAIAEKLAALTNLDFKAGS